MNCVDQPYLAPTTALRSTFSQHVLAEITVNNISGQALVDTGSTNSYLNKEFMKRNKLPYKTIKYFGNMADVSLKTEICGVSYMDLTFLEHHYKNFKFYVMSNVIEKSNSPWRAQPLVVDNGKGKRRMCIGYSRTIIFNAFNALMLHLFLTGGDCGDFPSLPVTLLVAFFFHFLCSVGNVIGFASHVSFLLFQLVSNHHGVCCISVCLKFSLLKP